MRERLFKMKQFKVRHRLSAMKVGVDAVLLGAWAHLPAAGKILDAGCGCGIISLMVAQRTNANVYIEAIDVDPLAVIEAKENFKLSPWAQNLSARRADFMTISGKYAAIISNPPFFCSGADPNSSARMLARHAGALSPVSLIKRASSLLESKGTLSLICPCDIEEEILKYAALHNMLPIHICRVSGRRGTPPKRLLIELKHLTEYQTNTLITEDTLAIEEAPKEYTDEYRRMTKDFYINM